MLALRKNYFEGHSNFNQHLALLTLCDRYFPDYYMTKRGSEWIVTITLDPRSLGYGRLFLVKCKRSLENERFE